MSRSTEQLAAFFRGLSPVQRWTLAGAALLALVAAVGVAWWSWQDRWVVVARLSEPSEARAFGEALEEEGIPYRIGADGSTVMVLPQDEGRARIAGASAGAAAGFEVLEGLQLGASPQRERWAYQRALQGELARTIASLDEVEAARVHLVLPEKDVFLRDESKGSASVTVRLRRGARLSETQVRGITALVAGAVDGIEPDDVVLVDQSGRLIAGAKGNDGEGGFVAGDLAELRAAAEARTRSAILAALTRVLGSPEHVAVGVTVEVESRSVDRTVRSQDPDSQVIVAETSHERTSTSSRPGGIPGTASNVPGGQGTASAGNSSSESEIETSAQYAYTEVEERSVEPAGRVKRVSVGVVVDAAAIAELAAALGAEGNEEEARAELQKRIEETVRVAMGYDEERGDQLVVSFLPFRSGADEGVEATGDAALLDRVAALLPHAIALVGMLLFFGVVVRPVVRAATRSGPAQLSQAETAALEDGAARAGEEEEEARPGRELAERLRSMVDNYETVEAKELNRLVALEREATAHVLHRWIRET